MYSFAIHNIGDDISLTNWEVPKTVQDKYIMLTKVKGMATTSEIL